MQHFGTLAAGSLKQFLCHRDWDGSTHASLFVLTYFSTSSFQYKLLQHQEEDSSASYQNSNNTRDPSGRHANPYPTVSLDADFSL